MDTPLDKSYQSIVDAPENSAFTEEDIPPLYLAPATAKLVIVGQAPGIRAQESRKPWNDPSGDRLRDWLAMTSETFYSDKVAHLPMDFYYPGKAKTGDKPPRKGFASKWHPLILDHLPNVELILLVGKYAQDYYLGSEKKRNLTETVRAYEEYLPRYFPLVHPSPLNTGWMKRNPWFEAEVLPELKRQVNDIL